MTNKVLGIVYALMAILVLSIMLPLQFAGLTAITVTANVALWTGLTAFCGLAPILILLFALFESGLISFAGFMGNKLGTRGIMSTIGAQIVLYVGIILFTTILTNWVTLYSASPASSQGFVALCPLLLFLGLILGSSWWSVASTGGMRAIKTWRQRRGYRRSARRK